MITKYLTAFFLVLLFAWISFFPEPIQARWHFFTNLALIFTPLIVLTKKRLILLRQTDYPLWIFLLAIGLNVFFAGQRSVALKTYIDLAIPMCCIYYLIAESSVAKESEIVPLVICSMSIIVALGGLADFLFKCNFLYEHFIPNSFYLRYKRYTGYMPAMSTQFHYPALGSYLIACLPFNFLLTAGKKPSLRLLGYIGTALGFAVMLMTFSRSAFLGFVAALLFFLYMNKKFKLLLISFAVFCLFAFLNSHMHNPLNKLGFEQILFRGNSPMFGEYRWDRLLMSMRMLRDHPFAGLGFQHIKLLFGQYYQGKGTVPAEFMIADNMYLTLLAETGLVGFTGFLVFVLAMLRKAWRKISKMNYGSQERFRLVAFLAAFIGLLVNMGGYEFFYWVSPYVCFCILAGYISALSANTDT